MFELPCMSSIQVDSLLLQIHVSVTFSVTFFCLCSAAVCKDTLHLLYCFTRTWPHSLPVDLCSALSLLSAFVFFLPLFCQPCAGSSFRFFLAWDSKIKKVCRWNQTSSAFVRFLLFYSPAGRLYEHILSCNPTPAKVYKINSNTAVSLYEWSSTVTLIETKL